MPPVSPKPRLSSKGRNTKAGATIISTWPLLNKLAKLDKLAGTGCAPILLTISACDLSQSMTAIFLPAAFSIEFIARSRT